MKDLDKSNKFTISVVIPAFNGERYLPIILKKIQAQTLLPHEIVIVDSSPASTTDDWLAQWQGPIPIVYKRIEFAYPGHARNVGVQLASSDWIAFLDCQTYPNADWLEISKLAVCKSGSEFVEGLCLSKANTSFKKILLAATYGLELMNTLPGSLVSKNLFVKSGGFLPMIRAGEDLEWKQRLKGEGIKSVRVQSATISYEGFAESLYEAIKKWYTYAVANATVDVRNNQKKLYFFAFFLLLPIFAYFWNFVFSIIGIRELYIPHITKTVVLFLFLFYVVFRGIIRPRQVQVPWSYLFPIRWMAISFVGFCLDTAKAPGLLLGAFLMLKRKFIRVLFQGSRSTNVNARTDTK